MGSIADNLERVRSTIERAAARAGRAAADVTIVGAVKTVAVERIRAAVELGLTDLGENYVSELRDRAPAFP
jgi:PLP dependent protein